MNVIHIHLNTKCRNSSRVYDVYRRYYDENRCTSGTNATGKYQDHQSLVSTTSTRSSASLRLLTSPNQSGPDDQRLLPCWTSYYIDMSIRYVEVNGVHYIGHLHVVPG